MILFKWNNRYNTGLMILDEQNQKLFELINNLDSCINTKIQTDIIDLRLKELLEYIFHHFNIEEEMYAKSDYPDYRLHRAEHDSLIKKLLELRGKFKAGNTTIVSELSTFLKSWLIIHILQSDMKFAKYIKSKNNSQYQIGIQYKAG